MKAIYLLAPMVLAGCATSPNIGHDVLAPSTSAKLAPVAPAWQPPADWSEPLWSRVGDSIKHGATAGRVFCQSTFSGAKIIEVTASPLSFVLIDVANRPVVSGSGGGSSNAVEKAASMLSPLLSGTAQKSGAKTDGKSVKKPKG